MEAANDRRTATTPGPIDFLAPEFPGNKFDGSILTSLEARVVMFERIPHEVVEENLAEMAAIGV